MRRRRPGHGDDPGAAELAVARARPAAPQLGRGGPAARRVAGAQDVVDHDRELVGRVHVGQQRDRPARAALPRPHPASASRCSDRGRDLGPASVGRTAAAAAGTDQLAESSGAAAAAARGPTTRRRSGPSTDRTNGRGPHRVRGGVRAVGRFSRGSS